MVQLIKKGGFREKAARQLKYKNSVNERADITAQPDYAANKSNQAARLDEQRSLPTDVPNHDSNQHTDSQK